MSPRRPVWATATLFGVLAPAIAATGTGRAQQSPASVRPSKALVPVAASSVIANPDAHYGQYVTLVGAVEERLSDSAFTVDQDSQAHTGNGLLILAPMLNGPLELNSYVTVIGEVVRFEPGQMGHLALEYPLDLPAHANAKYGGGPAVLATSVITPGLVDLARQLPPPMTAEESAYDQMMKRAGSEFAALQQASQQSQEEAIAAHAGVLKDTFAATEAFWKTRGKPDAAGWAREARTLCETIQHAARARRWNDVKRSTTLLAEPCQSCHAAYRERLEDGGYRIRPQTTAIE